VAKINVGLIGFGEWPQQAYAPALKDLAQVEVTALSARSETTRKLAGDAFGGALRYYDHWDALFADPQIDAVMMALPNELHAEVIEAAVAAGKHLFYEPPLALDHASSLRVLSKLAAARSVVQVDLELRYLPLIAALRSLLASGELGSLMTAKIRLWCNWGYGGAEWYDRAQGQSFFLFLGVWYLDVLDCFFEAAPTQAQVTGGYASNGNFMDHGWATLKYPQERIGLFEFNLVASVPAEISLHIVGSQGEVEADLQSGAYRWRQSGGAWQSKCAAASMPACGFEGMRESIHDFFDAISEKRAPIADVAVSRRVHEAAFACVAAEQGVH
jgi:predicted dehydrogenase